MPNETERKPLVFLDTSVIVSALRGDRTATKLFSPKIRGKFRYAVDPVVIEEILTSARSPETVDALRELGNSWQTLPLNETGLADLLKRANEFRNMAVHSNDLVILSSAMGSDYLLTNDRSLQQAGESEGVKTLSPEDFLAKVGDGG
jgi:predicted nucleic acid-binding protein